MTIITLVGVIMLFFITPYLVGNIYSLIFRKKDMSIVRQYFTGMILIYAFLFILQLLVVKMKFDLAKTTTLYNGVLAILLVLGIVALIVNILCKQKPRFDVCLNGKAIFVYGLILLQGILYIGLKNPYFENNGLLETTRTIVETGTIYEYNAFSGQISGAGFPLSNKLMFLPVLYAYLSNVFGINIALIFNFVMPIVTFVSFYMVMTLWVKKLAKDYNVNWIRILAVVVWLTQVGDYWVESTAFRVLHSGYMGEAIFFGGIFLYVLYELKNKCYLLSLVSLVSFPGLVKYDTVIDFLKDMDRYFVDSTYAGSLLVLYILGVGYFIWKYKKGNLYLLNPALTISLSLCFVWDKILSMKRAKGWRVCSGILLTVLFILCGNMTVISQTTQWRSNIYGANKEEYELLVELKERSDETEPVLVMAYSGLNKWIRRVDLNLVSVVGHDADLDAPSWYSYDTYEESYEKLWECVHYVTNNLETELMELSDEIPMDYVVLRRNTDILPIQNNPELKCVFQTPSYTVYSVDKK